MTCISRFLHPYYANAWVHSKTWYFFCPPMSIKAHLWMNYQTMVCFKTLISHMRFTLTILQLFYHRCRIYAGYGGGAVFLISSRLQPPNFVWSAHLANSRKLFFMSMILMAMKDQRTIARSSTRRCPVITSPHCAAFSFTKRSLLITSQLCNHASFWVFVTRWYEPSLSDTIVHIR